MAGVEGVSCRCPSPREDDLADGSCLVLSSAEASRSVRWHSDLDVLTHRVGHIVGGETASLCSKLQARVGGHLMGVAVPGADCGQSAACVSREGCTRW